MFYLEATKRYLNTHLNCGFNVVYNCSCVDLIFHFFVFGVDLKVHIGREDTFFFSRVWFEVQNFQWYNFLCSELVRFCTTFF
jgi:hypothetical protein